MAYNTQLVKPNEAPKKYEDLLAPRWKGRIGVNLQDPEWYVNLQRRWGKEKARNFLKALAAQQPGVRDGHNITAQLLAAGEFHAVTNTYAHIAARIKGQGGPVQYVFDEPVITYVHPIALIKSAPHPNAGKLLMSFILSAEGQRMLRDQGRIPGHRDIDPKVFPLRNVKLQASDPSLAKEYGPRAKKCGQFSAHVESSKFKQLERFERLGMNQSTRGCYDMNLFPSHRTTPLPGGYMGKILRVDLTHRNLAR